MDNFTKIKINVGTYIEILFSYFINKGKVLLKNKL